jgi:hypothetical protein
MRLGIEIASENLKLKSVKNREKENDSQEKKPEQHWSKYAHFVQNVKR